MEGIHVLHTSTASSQWPIWTPPRRSPRCVGRIVARFNAPGEKPPTAAAIVGA